MLAPCAGVPYVQILHLSVSKYVGIGYCVGAADEDTFGVA
jgi:hypothetical protein